jgi:4-hydroxybenzoate polyprenyltransferase
MHLARAKSYMAGGFALLAFVAALAVGTAGAPALGGLSWLMVTAGAAGAVYVSGFAMVTALVDMRTHSARGLRPATIVSARGGRPRSTDR